MQHSRMLRDPPPQTKRPELSSFGVGADPSLSADVSRERKSNGNPGSGRVRPPTLPKKTGRRPPRLSFRRWPRTIGALEFDLATGPRAMADLSIVTTCMGRLAQLRQTLGPMLAQDGGVPVVVVDYSCPDGAGDWVEANPPRARLVRVPGRARFNASAARNIGPAMPVPTPSGSPLWTPTSCSIRASPLRSGGWWRPAAGTGADRTIRGWAGRSSAPAATSSGSAATTRSTPAGAKRTTTSLTPSSSPAWSAGLTRPSSSGTWHTTTRRGRAYYPVADKELGHAINRVYRLVKWDIARINREQPRLELRRALYERVAEKVKAHFETGRASDLGVTLRPGSCRAVACSRVTWPTDSPGTRESPVGRRVAIRVGVTGDGALVAAAKSFDRVARNGASLRQRPSRPRESRVLQSTIRPTAQLNLWRWCGQLRHGAVCSTQHLPIAAQSIPLAINEQRAHPVSGPQPVAENPISFNSGPRTTDLSHQFPIRAQHFTSPGRQRGPPGGAAHARGQRADAAVGQADQDAAGVRGRSPGRVAVTEKRARLDLELRPGADGIGSTAGRQSRDRKPRLEPPGRQIHGRRQPGKQGRGAVRPRRAAVPERRRQSWGGTAGIFLRMQNRVRSAVRDVGEAGFALRTVWRQSPWHWVA